MILLDLDGVLANFRSAAAKVHGLLGQHETGWCDSWYPDWAPGKKKFWDPIFARGDSFYGFDVQPYEWMRTVFDLVCEADEDVRIATCSSGHHNAYKGKRAWVSHFLGDDVEVMIITDKWLMAHPDRLLVDDSDHQVDRFAQHGGKTLLFPQQWNRHSGFVKGRLPHVAARLDSWRNREVVT